MGFHHTPSHQTGCDTALAIQEQINKTASTESEMQNYIEELEESNDAQSSELEQALRDKRVANKSTRAASKATSNAKNWPQPD